MWAAKPGEHDDSSQQYAQYGRLRLECRQSVYWKRAEKMWGKQLIDDKVATSNDAGEQTKPRDLDIMTICVVLSFVSNIFPLDVITPQRIWDGDCLSTFGQTLRHYTYLAMHQFRSTSGVVLYARTFSWWWAGQGKTRKNWSEWKADLKRASCSTTVLSCNIPMGYRYDLVQIQVTKQAEKRCRNVSFLHQCRQRNLAFRRKEFAPLPQRCTLPSSCIHQPSRKSRENRHCHPLRSWCLPLWHLTGSHSVIIEVSWPSFRERIVAGLAVRWARLRQSACHSKRCHCVMSLQAFDVRVIPDLGHLPSPNPTNENDALERPRTEYYWPSS